MRLTFCRALVAALALAVFTSAAPAADFADVLKGQITYAKGMELPKLDDLKVDKDTEHCLSKGAIRSQDWVINKENNGLRYVIVALAPVEKDGTIPIHDALPKPDKLPPAVVDQPCCMFEPRVSAIRAGQSVKVLNPAPVAHNISWLGAGGMGNQIIPAGKDYTIEGLGKTKYPYSISCTIHPWMTGKVAVFDHPYFAVTDKDGKFEIPKPPVGKYKLMVWHESGWLGGKDGAKGIDIDIKAGANEKNLEWK